MFIYRMSNPKEEEFFRSLIKFQNSDTHQIRPQVECRIGRNPNTIIPVFSLVRCSIKNKCLYINFCELRIYTSFSKC